ncbi:NUDIX domain-containing protein, partial [Candidatus Sumerlaeota bacterium]
KAHRSSEGIMMPRTDPEKLRPAAACAIVFDEEKRVLLQQRSDNGLWAIPGGAIEAGETAAAAAIRETREETGYDVEVVRLLGVYSHPDDTTVRYPDGNSWEWVTVAFECRVTGGRPATSDETLDMQWYPTEALPSSLKPSHKSRILDALEGRQAAFYS